MLAIEAVMYDAVPVSSSTWQLETSSEVNHPGPLVGPVVFLSEILEATLQEMMITLHHKLEICVILILRVIARVATTTLAFSISTLHKSCNVIVVGSFKSGDFLSISDLCPSVPCRIGFLWNLPFSHGLEHARGIVPPPEIIPDDYITLDVILSL